MYFPILPKSMHALMDRVGPMLEKRETTFIDVGSGKGIALLVAAQYPFKKVLGVEFSSDLTEIAERNLRNYRGTLVCKNIEIKCMDAADYEFPGGPLLVYFYNPFDKPVMEMVLRNLTHSLNVEQRSEREIVVICDRLHDRALIAAYLRPRKCDVFLGFSIYSDIHQVADRVAL